MAANRFLPQHHLVAAIIPVDSQTGANNGDWVSLKNYKHLTAVLFKAVGIAGDNPVFTLRQATNVAGASAKALNFTQIYSALQVDITTSDAWTKATQAAANTYTAAASAEKSGFIVVEIDADMLDVGNGFDCVQLQIPDTGAAGAQLIAALYILSEPRYPATPENLPSAIVN